MEWIGCGIFGKLWRYFAPRKSSTPRELNEADCSIPSLDDIELNINTFPVEDPDPTSFDSLNPEFTRLAEDIHLEKLSEISRSTDDLQSEQIHQRAHSAHITFRPVLLFDEGPVTEEIRGTLRNNLDKQEKSFKTFGKSTQQPVLKIESSKVHAIACKHLAHVITSVEVQPNLKMNSAFDKDNVDTITANMGGDGTSHMRSKQWLTRKFEHFTLPTRSDEILHAIEDNLADRTDHSKEDSDSFETYNHHRTRMKHAYPYFMPESAYVKLKQEERWKDLRRELRLELETQVDCELLQRAKRIRKPHQLPSLPQTAESLEIVRLLTIPPSLSTLIRIGVTCKSRMKTSLQFPTVRSIQNTVYGVGASRRRRGTHRKHRRCRRNRAELLNNKQIPISARPSSSGNPNKALYHYSERPRTAEERPTNATEVIKLYKAAANLMCSYPNQVIAKNDPPIWTWCDLYETEENQKSTNKSSTYKDVLDNLLVRIGHERKRRDSSRCRKRAISHTHEYGDDANRLDSTVNKPISLIKVILEGVDWREGLLAQGAYLCADPDTAEEGFFCRLVTLERLQLLTRLEESEVIATNPEEDLVAIRLHRMKHGKHAKHSQRNSGNGNGAKTHNLPPLHPTVSKKKVAKADIVSRIPWNVHRPKFPSISPHQFRSIYPEDSPQNRLTTSVKHNSYKRTARIGPTSSPETQNPVNSPDPSNESLGLLSLPSLEASKMSSQWRQSIRTTPSRQRKDADPVKQFPGPRKPTRVKWRTTNVNEPSSTPNPIMDSRLRRDRKKRTTEIW